MRFPTGFVWHCWSPVSMAVSARNRPGRFLLNRPPWALTGLSESEQRPYHPTTFNNMSASPSADRDRRRSQRIPLALPLAVLSLHPYLEFSGDCNTTDV